MIPHQRIGFVAGYGGGGGGGGGGGLERSLSYSSLSYPTTGRPERTGLVSSLRSVHVVDKRSRMIV